MGKYYLRTGLSLTLREINTEIIWQRNLFTWFKSLRRNKIMKIQSLSFATQVRNNFKNIAFRNKPILKNLSDLKDVFEKMPVQTEEKSVPNEPKTEIRYYYLGKDENAHETTAPFVTKQTEFGDRLYIIRKGKPRAFFGFTVESNGEKEKTVIYKSGYPYITEENCGEDELKTTIYNPDNHKIQSIEKGKFKIEKDSSDDSFSIELRNIDDCGNIYNTILSISDNSDKLSYAEVSIYEPKSFSTKNASISWNYLDEIPKKLKDLDKNALKMFYENLRNLAITIQSNEYMNDFGCNNKFNHNLKEIIFQFNTQLDDF